jgi:hypothetical protein
MCDRLSIETDSKSQPILIVGAIVRKLRALRVVGHQTKLGILPGEVFPLVLSRDQT